MPLTRSPSTRRRLREKAGPRFCTMWALLTTPGSWTRELKSFVHDVRHRPAGRGDVAASARASGRVRRMTAVSTVRTVRHSIAVATSIGRVPQRRFPSLIPLGLSFLTACRGFGFDTCPVLRSYECAVERRHSLASANPARQLSLQSVAIGAGYGGEGSLSFSAHARVASTKKGDGPKPAAL